MIFYELKMHSAPKDIWHLDCLDAPSISVTNNLLLPFLMNILSTLYSNHIEDNGIERKGGKEREGNLNLGSVTSHLISNRYK